MVISIKDRKKHITETRQACPTIKAYEDAVPAKNGKEKPTCPGCIERDQRIMDLCVSVRSYQNLALEDRDKNVRLLLANRRRKGIPAPRKNRR